ncbi:MAG TPA: hypothetical protein VFL94_09520 [Actinomycetales bacterium]|nr:hypothetical protein [Actinomycetales bacterium]
MNLQLHHRGDHGTADARHAETAGVGAHDLHSPSYQAFLVLRTVFTIAPIVFGLDKFFNVLTDWTGYLAPFVDRIVPWSAQTDMYLVGVIEIVAGILVAVRPRIGAYVVTLWLLGIIVNLLLIPGFYDVALRDFGLLVAAFALARLSAVYDTVHHALAAEPAQLS